MPAELTSSRPLRLMLGGDTMLGRTVRHYILRFGAGYPLGPIEDLLRRADLSIVNLECAVTSSQQVWPGEPKAFYFGAPPQAAQSLQEAGIDLVSLANNHLLDFGYAGMYDTLRLLGKAGVGHAGAGVDLDAARLPAHIERQGVRFGMAAFCNHQADFAAGKDRPGIAYLDLTDEAAASAAFRHALGALHGVQWPILSLHWGPNMEWRPAQPMRRLAHAAVEMGWKIVYGHSAHVFQGIEIYRGCPIFYATGDLVDDYYVDPAFRNDHQVLFELKLRGGKVDAIRLHPLFIEACQVRPASAHQARYIGERMHELCAELGTSLRREPGRMWIELPAA